METLKKLFKTSDQSNASATNFTCEICTEAVPLNEKFKNMEASGCSHPYCRNCVAKYIETKVMHHNMSDIKCPNTSCVVLLDASSCRSVLSKKVYEKWCRVLCESAVLLDASKGGFVHGRSFCPNRKCSELILNECEGTKSNVKRSDCPNCKEVFCFSCMIPWKENHQCRQASGDTIIDIGMDRNDVLFMEMVKRKRWVRCPNCNNCVELLRVTEYYCSHIICRFVRISL
ncbi:hypothetical protein MKW94_004114 [Papaver nudicaule]|uniref:Uncharacterized protein n=1 Tax=Papaver nudicaule TaxID=74823 RepID=A0AA41RYL5_PAPNU|nr:hypothetical protein [Papaver nudicaule]